MKNLDAQRVGCTGGYGKQELFDSYCLFWWHGSLQKGTGAYLEKN